ncbi:MAG: hypothetical protein ABI700_29340 [Chloroflexota bacterium]
MTRKREQAKALDAFLSAYQAGEAVTPSTPEAEFAADLVDLAASLRAATRPSPDLHSPDLDERELEEEYRLMIALGHRQSVRQPVRQSVWNVPLTLVATLLLFLFVGALLAPFVNLPTFAPPVAESRLPLPVGGQLTDLDPAALKLMQTAGITWTAFALPYQRADAAALVEQARTLIDGAHQAGFKILLNVSGAPEQIAGDDGFAAYADLMGKVAALGADALQVWDAPNLAANWTGAIDPARYVDLLRQSYSAIKAAHADTEVISAAPAPTSGQNAFGSDQMWNDDVFYQGMAQAGAAESADCIGVNYYEGAVAPTATSGDPRDNGTTRYFVPMLQRAATPFRESGLPLCLTEFGYFSAQGGTPPDGFAWASATTSEQQAQWLAGGIETAAQLSSVRVEMILLYRMTTGSTPVENGYALIRPDGKCLACNAIELLHD